MQSTPQARQYTHKRTRKKIKKSYLGCGCVILEGVTKKKYNTIVHMTFLKLIPIKDEDDSNGWTDCKLLISNNNPLFGRIHEFKRDNKLPG